MTRSRTRAKKQRRLVEMLRSCPNCGQRGPHFVPPSLGDPGFYICTAKAAEQPTEAG